MPAFATPSTFYAIRRMAPSMPLTASDMAGILMEHVTAFLASPAAYAGLGATSVSGLLGSLEMFYDPELLLQSGAEEWVFITPGPAPVKATRQTSLADMGLTVENSAAPLPLGGTKTLQYAAGCIPDRSLFLMERQILVVVSAGTRAGTFRAADAMYTWMSDMSVSFRLEFNAKAVLVDPVRVVGEAERPLYAGAAGNPAIIPIRVMSRRRATHKLSDPA